MDVVTLGAAKAAAKRNQAPIRAIAPGFEIVNPAALQKWQASFADCQTVAAPITVAGHSISVGIGADNIGGDGDPVIFRTKGWVGQLRNLFASRYGDPGEGFIGSKDYGYGATPSRRTYAGGGLTDIGQGPFYNGSRLNSTSQTVTFTTSEGSIIKFWVWTGGSGTGATFVVDGGSNTATYVDPADGVTKTTAANTIPTCGTGDVNSLTWTEYTISGLSAGTHSIVFAGPTSGSLRIGDIGIYKQATGVPVHRVGWSGSTSANLVGEDSTLAANSLGKTRMMHANTKMFGSKLLILEFGTNDYGLQNSLGTTFGQPGTTPTQLAANLRTAGDIAIANGASVLLLGDPRRQNNPVSPENYTEAAYIAAVKNIALTTPGYAYIDFADAIGDKTTAMSLGYANTNSVHPKRAGHGRMAQAVFEAITRPYGIAAPVN